MPVSIVPASLRDMTFIAANMRPADWREITAVYPATATEIGASMWFSSEGLRWVALLNGSPVCAFGIAPGLPGVGSGWAYGTRKMPRVMREVTKFIRRRVAVTLLRAGYRRIEVRTAIDHDVSHRWLESLGFVREGIAVDYGSDGLDFITYACRKKDWK